MNNIMQVFFYYNIYLQNLYYGFQKFNNNIYIYIIQKQ